MTKRAVLALGTLALVPAPARAQGVEIDHKQVGCIVAGKFPKMGACFSPASQVARSRVYFRPQGTPSWYYVEMKSDEPCLAGILPKPSKKLVGTKVEYYVEAQDRTFNAARTAEFAPIVVASGGECEKDVPVAPFVNNATVAVFPSVPAGFVGSAAIGTTAIVGVAAAGAAVAGTAAVIASNDEATTTTVAVGGNTTTTIAATTTTTTTTTTTIPPPTNRAPVARLTTIPDPPRGVGPLTVTFDMCASSDPDGDPLSFFFDFGDGAQTSGACSQSHTYSASFRAASAAARTYEFSGSAVDRFGASQTRTREVEVLDPSCPTPTVRITEPDEEDFVCSPVRVEASTTDASAVTFCAEQAPIENCSPSAQDAGAARAPAPPTCVPGTSSGGGQFSASVPLAEEFRCYLITAQATNTCGGTAADSVSVFFFSSGFCSESLSRGPARVIAWSSDLAVEAGRVQLIVNAASPAFPGRGRSFGTSRLVAGENRVEATLVEAAGKGGLWRIDLRPEEAILSGSLRVIAGEVVSVGPTSVTFRMSGRPGERVVFSFFRK
jgi:hypothetical protein